jgi:hypothetical protein
MKKILYSILIVLLLTNLGFSQRAKIVTEAVTPHRLTTLGINTNSVSTGLDVVGNQTYVYLSAQNIGNTQPIISANFQLLSSPTGSVAALESMTNPLWTMFKPDVRGSYTVKLTITTSGGTHDTTKTITAGNFVGVGGFDGVAPQYPNCMTCHSFNATFTDIFDRWKDSKHATGLKRKFDTGPAHFNQSCIKCHSTGYDHNIAASNNGFDDIAANLNWSWAGAPAAGKWNAFKASFPSLVNHATIGCESCHGPGSEHAIGGVTSKIQVTAIDGTCGQCHDEPWRHNRFALYEVSGHSKAVWSNSFAQAAASQNNNLQNCIRCHDGNGFINFTKGKTTNTTGMVAASQMKITCAACHDPHGNSNVYSLRNTPAGSDTLGNGFSYSGMLGRGNLCMNCHKSRRNADVYVATTTNVNAQFGPHYGVQGDVIMGTNAATFNGVPYQSGNHKWALANGCVSCHMAATTDTSHASRDKVGGHSMSLYDANNNYYHTKGCVSCHGPRNSWNDFIAMSDYDGDGVVEPIPAEINGLLKALQKQLPPAGQDTIILSQITTLDQRKAYYNYRLIYYDGSQGMHNTRFTVNVLTTSIINLGGVIPVELIAFDATINGNTVTLNWQTATEVNNSGFQVERKYEGGNWESIAFVTGKGTVTEVQNYSYLDETVDLSKTKVIYRLKQIDYDGTSAYSKEIEAVLENAPAEFALSQNYPNPFNPSTKINFTIPSESNVKLTVYNVSGENVLEVVNGVKPAGNHEAVINMASPVKLSSGVYFYKLEVTSLDGSKKFRETKKMVLLK